MNKLQRCNLIVIKHNIHIIEQKLVNFLKLRSYEHPVDVNELFRLYLKIFSHVIVNQLDYMESINILLTFHLGQWEMKYRIVQL